MIYEFKLVGHISENVYDCISNPWTVLCSDMSSNLYLTQKKITIRIYQTFLIQVIASVCFKIPTNIFPASQINKLKQKETR